MKISEGCNRTCSFCAIPLMRGAHVSRPIEELVHEAQQLAKRGVKEIILIAQELTYYGLDLYKKRELNKLLAALNEVDGIEWIRLHYAYPSKFPVEVFDAIAALPKVCNYLDIPLQHANDAVMSRMKRQTTRTYMEELLDLARTKIPNLAIRTTFLIGFPGETEEEFQDLMAFVEAQRFDRVGVFAYSHEDGTTAFDMADDVPEEDKRDRISRLMEMQKDISMEKNVARIGQKLKVLIDRKEGEYYIGRTEYDSPEVDNEVLIKANDQYLREGDFVMAEIIDAEEFDLYAKVIL
jgi:ribosomal protein S12 methylthiotransferase